MIGHLVAAERHCMKANIDEQDVDLVRGRKVDKCVGKVDRQQRDMAQLFNQQLGVQANE